MSGTYSVCTLQKFYFILLKIRTRFNLITQRLDGKIENSFRDIICSCSTPITSSRMYCSRRIETSPKGLRNEPVVDIKFYPVDSQIERAT